jgi:hypothetical protein
MEDGPSLQQQTNVFEEFNKKGSMKFSIVSSKDRSPEVLDPWPARLMPLMS